MRYLLICALLPIIAAGQERFTPQDYINTYKDMAIAEMERSGVPASITLAQGILESGSGNSDLAKKAKNHFGIKGHRDWTGDCYILTDDAEDECFRVYSSVAESFADHSNFLLGHQRYASLFELRSTDYRGWAKGLKQAGYATNPEYANIIIRLIEKYELHQFDIQEKKRFLRKDIPDFFEINKTEAIAYDGQMTEREIRDKYFFGAWQIYKYNDLKKGQKLKKGMVIYLKPKRNRNSVIGQHKVTEGENMQYISQLRGIKLRKLYKLNNMEKGEEPAIGQVLNLDKKRDGKPTLANNPHDDFVYYTIETKTPPAPEPQSDEPEIAEKAPVKKNDGIYHKVAPGESLSSIARAYGLDWKILKAQNGLKDNNIVVGQLLLVEPQAEMAIETNPEPQSEPGPQEVVADKNGKHIVRPSDTIFEIARINGLTVAELMRLNDLEDPSIQAGQVLKLQ